MLKKIASNTRVVINLHTDLFPYIKMTYKFFKFTIWFKIFSSLYLVHVGSYSIIFAFKCTSSKTFCLKQTLFTILIFVTLFLML